MELNGDSAGITVTQVGTGLGTGATFTTTAVLPTIIIKCNRQEPVVICCLELIKVNFGRTLPGFRLLFQFASWGVHGVCPAVPHTHCLGLN